MIAGPASTLAVLDRAPGNGELSWVRGDVSDPAETAAAVDVIRERYPVIDVVVNNAGGSVRAGAGLD